MPDARPTDTSPEAHALQLELYRRMGPSGRAAAASRLTDAARRLTEAGIRARHPNYTPSQVLLAFARIRIGDELVRKVWPDQPLVEP